MKKKKESKAAKDERRKKLIQKLETELTKAYEKKLKDFTAKEKAFNDARTVPAVVFTDPEVATAGLMEHEAKELHLVVCGTKVHIERFEMHAYACTF